MLTRTDHPQLAVGRQLAAEAVVELGSAAVNESLEVLGVGAGVKGRVVAADERVTAGGQSSGQQETDDEALERRALHGVLLCGESVLMDAAPD